MIINMYKITHLKDLLPAGRNVQVEYRCNAPKHCDEEDMLFGFAIWDGETLESGDGDNYYLYDIVVDHIWKDENHLTIWIEVHWSSDPPKPIQYNYIPVDEKHPHGGLFEDLTSLRRGYKFNGNP